MGTIIARAAMDLEEELEKKEASMDVVTDSSEDATSLGEDSEPSGPLGLSWPHAMSTI